MQTVTDSQGQVVCDRCTIADTALARMRGLLGRSGLEPGEGVLLRPAPSIHTWFMRFNIDAVFLDKDLRVLEVRDNLGPWRFAARRGARAVLELAAGEAVRRGIAPGQRLTLVSERDALPIVEIADHVFLRIGSRRRPATFNAGQGRVDRGNPGRTDEDPHRR